MRMIALVTALFISFPPYSPNAALRCHWNAILKPDMDAMIRVILRDCPIPDDFPPADIDPPPPGDDGDDQPPPEIHKPLPDDGGDDNAGGDESET